MALLVAAPAAAQTPGRPDPCGALENKAGALESLSRYFVDPARATILGGFGVAQPGPDAPRDVVVDPRVCSAFMGRVRAQLGRSGVLRELRPEGFDFAVLRYGPYLTALVTERPQEGAVLAHGYTELVIFDDETLRYVGSIVERAAGALYRFARCRSSMSRSSVNESGTETGSKQSSSSQAW